MEFNYFALFICGVLAMGMGYLWYGPLFGKAWLSVIGATDLDIEKRKEMEKHAMPLYLIQFVLTLIQFYYLLKFMKGWEEADGVGTSLMVWWAFIVPTLAGCAMWNNNPTRVKWAMFLIQAGYQLVVLISVGWILGEWGIRV